MDLVRTGQETLTQAETRLKDLASAAIAQNEWDAVTILAAWAKGLRTLLEGSLVENSSSPTAYRSPEGSKKESTAPSTSNLASSMSDPGVPKRFQTRSDRGTEAFQSQPGPNSVGAKSRPPTVGKKYPRFSRHADNLVKVGWSKKARKEYQHQAPKRVLDVLTATIQSISAKSPQFTIEELLPRITERGGTETPSYQTYLCVAWLRGEDLLQQHGRQGYSVRDRTTFADSVEKVWELMPSKA